MVILKTRNICLVSQGLKPDGFAKRIVYLLRGILRVHRSRFTVQGLQDSALLALEKAYKNGNFR